MSRNAHTARLPLRRSHPWLTAALGLSAAIGAGLLLAELLMAPPAGDLRALAAYLTLAGAATTGGGWLALQAAERAVGLSIALKSFLSAAIGGAVALLNVFIVAQLMFVSTSHDLKLLIALIVFSAIVTVLFSLWAATTITARLQVVAAGIRALAGGDLRVQLEVPGGDEVARLAEDVNVLATRLREAEAQQQALDRERRELTAAVSHDLRTPLASVRAMVEALDDGLIDSTDEVGRYYGTIRREIERLSRMIDDLFELAQIDAGALKLQRRPVALQEIAAEVVDAMREQARRADTALRLEADPTLPPLPLDGARMERAAMNLVRNALEHTPPGGSVTVQVTAADGAAVLAVADTGEGIEPGDVARVWERFYRAEKSRRRGAHGSDGAGLGLAIVKGIVEAHGGRVTLESAPGRGTTVCVHLPLDS